MLEGKLGFGLSLPQIDLLDSGDDPFLGPEAPSDEQKGELASKASSILMKVLYGARTARWDLLKIVQLLASRVTTWSRGCDRAPHRRMCYINCTTDYVLTGFVGDELEDLSLIIYADADFAGDRPYPRPARPYASSVRTPVTPHGLPR